MPGRPPLDASGVLTSRLLHFLAGQLPSAQEERGDWQLDQALQLASEDKTLFSPEEIETVQDRILYANEVKMGLESKRGLTKYLQAREYLKVSKGAFNYVKSVSARARVAVLGRDSAVPIHDTISVQRQRELVSHLDAVPFQAMVPDLFLMDPEARGGTRLYYQDSLDANLSVHLDPRATTISKQLGAKIKPKIADLVERMYDFRTGRASASISHNAVSAQELLKQLNFIHPEPRSGRDPYRHPIIQQAINNIWFRNKDDIGVVDHKRFSPIPISILAITLTVIEWCINEWSDGTLRVAIWDDAKFQTMYDSHVSSLLHFQAKSPESLYQLQCDLLRNAREHAGAPPDPVTGMSRFPPGALDVREDSQPSPTAPPGYDDTMGPQIIINRV